VSLAGERHLLAGFLRCGVRVADISCSKLFYGAEASVAGTGSPRGDISSLDSGAAPRQCATSLLPSGAEQWVDSAVGVGPVVGKDLWSWRRAASSVLRHLFGACQQTCAKELASYRGQAGLACICTCIDPGRQPSLWCAMLCNLHITASGW
jgi:hypothetical protein